MLSDLEIREGLHIAIMRERERRHVKTDGELAQQLGILPKHLSDWKNARLTRLDRVLVELLLRSLAAIEPIEDLS